MIRQTENIADLAAALAQAQAELENVTKDRENPHFRSRYADLAGVLDEARPKLAKHGLSISQWPINGEGGQIGILTRLLHSSGQYLEGEFYVLPTKADPQGAGSALTYARRYCAMAVAGIAPEDDDGEAAVGRDSPRPQQDHDGGMATVRRAMSPGTVASAAATAARQRVKMLIDQYQAKIISAPHAHALENVAEDSRLDLEEIERSGTAGAAAAKELRRRYEVRMREFEDGGGPGD